MLVEDSITFASNKAVFYNPAMRFCRSISSLALGAAGGKLSVVDAFCASGIRGIRYSSENRNVSEISFLDIDKNAIALAKKNAKTNKIKKVRFALGNISRLAFDMDADFLEIDPFGTPSPYLVDAMRFFNKKKSGYLSVTATDVAVLCGGRTAACMKNYHSKPLNNDFTHENGLRIMIKRIAEVAAEFNMGIRPLVSFSDKHYLKSIVLLNRSADLAFESLKKIGYISHCRKCGFRSAGNFPKHCANTDCTNVQTEPHSDQDHRDDNTNSYAGPLWTGDLHDSTFLERMIGLNEKRDYSDKEEIAKKLKLMLGEVGMPPYFYNIHTLCRLYATGGVPPLEGVLNRISAAGYSAVRTHFNPLSIKTNAPYEKIVEAIRWKN